MYRAALSHNQSARPPPIPIHTRHTGSLLSLSIFARALSVIVSGEERRKRRSSELLLLLTVSRGCSICGAASRQLSRRPTAQATASNRLAL